jgi:uncharacterized protein YuzE
LIHHLARIAEHGNRVLRVVFNNQVSPGASGDGLLRSKAERQSMKLRVDEQADALYLHLDESKIIESDEVAPGVILDYNEKNEVVGVEIFGLSRRVPKVNLKEFQFQSA